MGEGMGTLGTSQMGNKNPKENTEGGLICKHSPCSIRKDVRIHKMATAGIIGEGMEGEGRKTLIPNPPCVP